MLTRASFLILVCSEASSGTTDAAYPSSTSSSASLVVHLERAELSLTKDDEAERSSASPSSDKTCSLCRFSSTIGRRSSSPVEKSAPQLCSSCTAPVCLMYFLSSFFPVGFSEKADSNFSRTASNTPTPLPAPLEQN